MGAREGYARPIDWAIGVVLPRRIGAGAEPAQRDGKAAAGRRGPAHDVVEPTRRWPPPWLAAALDDDHAGAARAGIGRQQARRIRRDIRLLLLVGGRRGDIEECAGRRDVLVAAGVGQEAVVANAVEAPGAAHAGESAG